MSLKAATWDARTKPSVSLKRTGKRTQGLKLSGLRPVGQETCASHTLRQGLTVEIGKGANAGGSAVSGLEMTQNSQRVPWTAEQVDGQLKRIMTSCFNIGIDTAMEYVNATQGELPSLLAGTNIAGFSKVAATMHAQGEWW